MTYANRGTGRPAALWTRIPERGEGSKPSLRANDVSTCSKCGEIKPVTEFPRRTNGRPGSWCFVCKRAWDRHAYSNDLGQGVNRKEKLRAHSIAANVQSTNFILNHLLAHPCTDCGEDDLVVLEFDHLPGHVKQFNIGSMNGMKIEKIQKEIAKCEVVCANCHRRRTANRVGWKRLTHSEIV